MGGVLAVQDRRRGKWGWGWEIATRGGRRQKRAMGSRRGGVKGVKLIVVGDIGRERTGWEGRGEGGADLSRSCGRGREKWGADECG